MVHYIRERDFLRHRVALVTSRGLEKRWEKRAAREKETEREVALSSIYTSLRSRLRETGAFPSRPGIECRRERSRRKEEVSRRRFVFGGPLTSYDRIVNYNLFSFAPNVRAPVPIGVPGKARTEIANRPFNNDRLFSLCMCGLRACSRELCPNPERC